MLLFPAVTMSQCKLLFSSVLIATTLKLYLAFTTHGTTDVDGFYDHLTQIRRLGVGAYHTRGPFDNPFNSPPPMIYVIKAIGLLSELTSLPFHFWLRFFPIMAGVISLLVVWRLLKHCTELFPLLLALAFSPVSIIIDGYHGNTDSIVFMFVLLAIFFIDRPVLSGLVFGLGCCVKVVPLMFLAPFLLYLSNMKARFKFTLTGAGVFLFASMPFIVQDPIAIEKVVFGYGSIYGTWGIPQIAAIIYPVSYVHAPFEPLGIHRMIAITLKCLAVAFIAVLSVWMNRNRLSLFLQCGVITALILFLAPGFGPQYLVWMVPFVLLSGLRKTIIYYLLVSLYLLYKYTGLTEVRWLVPFGFALSVYCWLFLALMLSDYIRAAREARIDKKPQRAVHPMSHTEIVPPTECE